jgi:tRNA pseudouridine32 synthase/23S rRNA pseudouridine746 synthase
VLEFLCQRFSAVLPSEWERRLDNAEVLNAQGLPLNRHSPFAPHVRLYYYRTVAHEPQIDAQEIVLYQDAHIVVVDKPHFLPVVPSGKYVQETVLVRLKNKLGLPQLTPIHRIDRDTAGLVLFSCNPESRNAYHALFRERKISKIYHAVAPWNANLAWPIERSSRITAAKHFMQQTESEGSPNAISTIRPLSVNAPLALYELRPTTGQRHQLRVHMAALGLPICNDGIYPHLTPEATPDYDKPLQLLAQSLSFQDPISGKHQQFKTTRSLRNAV